MSRRPLLKPTNRTNPVSSQAGRRGIYQPINRTTPDVALMNLEEMTEEELQVRTLEDDIQKHQHQVDILKDRILLYKVLLWIVSALLIYKWFF